VCRFVTDRTIDERNFLMLARVFARLNPAIAISCIALFIALAGVAVAASSYVGGDGKITGCVERQGDLRVVKAGKSCSKGERTLKWSSRGQKGAPGRNGTDGISGTDGTDGTNGRDAASMLLGSTDGGIGALAPNASVFLAPVGQSDVAGSAAGAAVQRSPDAAVVARDLSVEVDTAPPTDASLKFVLQAGGNPGALADTALTCTVPSGQTTCHDNTHTVNLPAGSDVTLRVVNVGTAAATDTEVRYGWRATTP
jgi:hypothetical protein